MCPLEGDEMQLILVISKGAEMKSKFLFAKMLFLFFFSLLCFSIQEFSCLGRLEDICSPDCLNINLYFKIHLYA